MKKLITFILALFIGTWVLGQTPVGTGQTYTTLGAAFTAINNGTLTGAVVLQLVSSTTESATAVLNASGTGGANYSSVTIYPTGSGYSVSGSIAGALIQLNDADYVTIDGRVNQSGAMDLGISNTNTGGQAIVFINDATNNIVRYCNITGVNNTASSGVIVFSTSTGTLGNSNNLITYCDVHDGATTPANLIYSAGSTTAINVSNTVSYCNLYNWFLSTTSHTGAIFMVNATSTWTIDANSFYQTASRTYSNATANVVSAIYMSNTVSGQNFTITNNYIGGSAPNCGGSPMTLSATTGVPVYRFLYYTGMGGGITSLIQGNTFANMVLSTATSSTANTCISHIGGNIQAIYNTIGSQSATGNIAVTFTGINTSAWFCGFSSGSSTTIASNIEFSYNNIGGITVSNSSTGAAQIRLMYSQAIPGSTVTINNNTVGGTVANSVQQNTNQAIYGILILSNLTGANVNDNVIRNITKNNAGTSNFFVGISISATGTPTSGGGHTISGNQIYNLTTNSTNALINNAASINGITMTVSYSGGTKITNNTIYNLTNTDNSVAGWINGIYLGTGTTPATVISGNKIYGLSLSTTTGGMGGIFIPNIGTAMIYNNQISLGQDASGADLTNPLEIYGIWKASTANVGVYHNSINITGNNIGGAGAEVSVGFVRTTAGTADTVMNNSFYNSRSNGIGTGTHYGVYYANLTGLIADYNDLYADGTNGYLGSDAVYYYTTLPAWQAGTLLDTYSISGNPSYTSYSNLAPQNNSPLSGMAYKLNHVPTDFAGTSRGGVTTIGAFEMVGLTSPTSLSWTGAQDENWHNPYNWNGTSEIPNATTNVVIPTGVPNYPTLQRTGYCNNIDMLSDGSGTATLLDNSLLAIGGAQSVQRYFSGNDVDWHLVSSPVVSETSNVFLAMYLQSFSEATNSYTEIVPTTTPLYVMQGYGLYSNLANNNTVTFNGDFNLGNQSVGFTASNQGWNLLGNPYVSSIDWEAVTIPLGLSNEVHYIDAATGNDLSYVQGTGGFGSQYIAPMQGFFVKATSAGTLSLGDADRSHTGGSSFYKSGTDQLLILEASGENYSDQAWIHFNNEAGVEHDGIFDAYKRISLSNPELPQIFSYTPGGERLSINGMPEATTVPVGFTAAESGIFTIDAMETGMLENVVLEDLATGIFTDLLQSDYSFQYVAGSNENRFVVHFTPLSIGDKLAEEVNIFAYANIACVNVPENTRGDIKVYNMIGQVVATAPVSNGSNRITIPVTGSYLVKVTTNDKVFTQKINIQ